MTSDNNAQWLPYFSYEHACIYETVVRHESGHDDVCGCQQFPTKREAQVALIRRLEDFVKLNQAVVDDAKVRIAQIKAAMNNYPYNA